MKTYRRHAFPPLARVRAASEQRDACAAPDEVGLFATQLHAPLAEELLDEARQAGYDAGHADGFAAGERAGADGARRDVRAGLDALAAPIDALAAGFQRAQQAYRAKVRDEVAALVGNVARQVVRAELEARPERILAFVDEAVDTLAKTPESVSVRLNPVDYARIAEVAPERARGWRLVPDDRLEPGECRVQADDVEMDAGCGQRLAACIERIAAQLAHVDTEHAEGVAA
ncbi:FliH/SctL family protein [Burkholderia sp. BE17]|uniref:FliH/SctL family protein n=1 Tax=Burkholderia sp. BE17 TaxID=2656644 RepID=UPI00128D1172|nr:FliH/SctL family protein [Burkholderia sp. BE17]MPV70237.1 flagellar assembly protein FliH [Burkholderia sp. BE17]